MHFNRFFSPNYSIIKWKKKVKTQALTSSSSSDADKKLNVQPKPAKVQTQGEYQIPPNLIPTCRHAKFTLGTAEAKIFFLCFSFNIIFVQFNQLIENEEKEKKKNTKKVAARRSCTENIFCAFRCVMKSQKNVFFVKKKKKVKQEKRKKMISLNAIK